MRSLRVMRMAEWHYGAVLGRLYTQQPDLARKSYEDQQQILFAQRLVYSDSFARGMRRLGHTAEEVIYDLKPLQAAWARERGTTYRDARWKLDIALAQIERFKPDVLYFQDIYTLPHAVRRDLKRRFSFIKKIIIFKGTASALDQVGDADVIFAATPQLVREFEQRGIRARLLYHGFDEAILDDLSSPAADSEHDLTFVGSSGFGWGLAHQARFWTLNRLMRELPLEAWVDERADTLKNWRFQLWRMLKGWVQTQSDPYLNAVGQSASAPAWLRATANEVLSERRGARENARCYPREVFFEKPREPERALGDLFAGRCFAPLYGRGMLALLHGSRITFNRHGDTVIDCAGNMRLFEATGVGTCLITEAAENLTDLFEKDREVLTYACADECVEKIRYYLNHEPERARIAAAGQRRTLKDHTTYHRCAQINTVLQEIL